MTGSYSHMSTNDAVEKYWKIIVAALGSIGTISVFIISVTYAFGKGQSDQEHRLEKLETRVSVVEKTSVKEHRLEKLETRVEVLERNGVRLETTLSGIMTELTKLNTNIEWIMREREEKK